MPVVHFALSLNRIAHRRRPRADRSRPFGKMRRNIRLHRTAYGGPRPLPTEGDAERRAA